MIIEKGIKEIARLWTRQIFWVTFTFALHCKYANHVHY